MKRPFFLLLATIAVFVGLITLLGYKLSSYTVTEAQEAVPTQCIGEALAEYMNTVLEAVNPQKLKLTSPIFNLTNPAEREIFDYMAQAGADFSSLDAFIGNTYTLSGVLAYDWYATQYGWAQAFEANGGHPVIFSEFGDFDQDFATMRSEFSRSASDGKIIGINFFNAAATGNNTQFSHHIIPSAEFQSIISANPSKAGINTAADINTGNITTAFNHSGGQIDWIVEIITGPSLEGVKASLQTASSLGVNNYVIRLCYATGCGFEDPTILADFIQKLDTAIPDGMNVYIVLGPNEPATERWAAADCVLEREYTLQEVACNSTQDPEFHSLRPYPASPACNPAPDGVWMCGNDLVVRHTYTLDRRDADSCSDEGGRERCTYNVDGSATAYMDLTGADYPIAGNTEKVPNAISSTNRLRDPSRVNEYVSWYLNGVIGRAEESNINVNSPTALRRLIDFSGPLRKLLPRFIQTTERREELSNFYAGARHNQIIECGGDSATPCYDNPSSVPQRYRITDQGNENSTQFPYTPFSSTEDRTGEIEVGTKSKHQDRPGPDGNISIDNITFNPTTPAPPNQMLSNFIIPSEESSKALYFPHIDENGQLSELLQFTYLPQGMDGRAGSFSDTDDIVSEAYPQYCDNIEARDNDGDSLYGDNVRQGSDSFLQILRGGQQVQEKRAEGNISYTAKFDCVLDKPYEQCTTVPIFDPISGFPIGETQNCETIYPKCEVPVPVAFGVAIATPDADNIWDRLVASHMSFFKRIFPQFGDRTPIQELEDIPGKTRVRYGSNSHSSNVGDIDGDTLAGDPTKSRSGGQAELFFPHLGGIQEYFLYGVQEALRPRGIASTAPGNSGPGSGVPSGTCDPENFRDKFGADADKVACVCDKESGGGRASAVNKGCLLTGPQSTWDYSVGLFQINLLVHPNVPPPDLVEKFREAGYANASELNCPDAFSSIGKTYKDGRIFRMREACVVQDQQLLNICVEYYSDPANNVAYAADLASRSGWGHWSITARQCGLIQ